MRWFAVVGVVMDLVGLIWLLQGLNVLGGSVMTGDPFWARTGLVLIVIGTIIVALALLRRARQAKR
jgi:hypothetical protein